MLKKIIQFLSGSNYWFLLLSIALGLELAALFYQYVLDYLPCVVCIQIRVWLLGVIVVALLGYFLKPDIIQAILHLLMVSMLAGFTERSYQVLGIERGFVFGACNMDAGLPSWFALDQWLPSIFKVWESCGYTPLILLNISMAEVLMVLSSLLFILAVIVFSLFVYTRVISTRQGRA